MEDVLVGHHLFIDKELLESHQQYWNEDTIQSFWSGESFLATDEGQQLSYHLAHIVVRNICQNSMAFTKFCNGANYEDAGETAAQEFLGLSLTQIVGTFLGDGDWQPNDQFTLSI